jgi:hypothetical protein
MKTKPDSETRAGRAFSFEDSPGPTPSSLALSSCAVQAVPDNFEGGPDGVHA